MAAELVTPIDGLTGLPLPIIPGCYEIPLDKPDEADPHHAFHPEFLVKKSPGLIALRNCRIQIVETKFHNQTATAYHRMYSGPTLPGDDSQIFRLVVPACAGATSWDGIDMSGDEPVVRRMTEEEYQTLWTPSDDDEFGHRYVYYNYEPVRDFFVDYLLKQDLKHEEKIVDKFLHAPSLETKQFLGHILLAKAAEVATDSERNQYTLLRRRGLLHPAMPPSPQTLVKHKLGRPSKRAQLIPRLEELLREQFDEAA